MDSSFFGWNGKLEKPVSIVTKETYDDWKNGKLIYFLDEECFATYDVTEERDYKIRSFFDDRDVHYGNKRSYHSTADEWHEKWDGMSQQEKQEWYMQYLRENYTVFTYEEASLVMDISATPIVIRSDDGNIEAYIFKN